MSIHFGWHINYQMRHHYVIWCNIIISHLDAYKPLYKLHFTWLWHHLTTYMVTIIHHNKGAVCCRNLHTTAYVVGTYIQQPMIRQSLRHLWRHLHWHLKNLSWFILYTAHRNVGMSEQNMDINIDWYIEGVSRTSLSQHIRLTVISVGCISPNHLFVLCPFSDTREP
jgi:hypothetical protein